MTDKEFQTIKVGDTLADMHYGTDQLKDRFDIVLHLHWDEPDRVNFRPLPKGSHGYVEHPFFDYLDQFTPRGGYTNKMLTVIGKMHPLLTRNVEEPTIIAAYCYDGRRSGIVALKEKRAPWTPEQLDALKKVADALQAALPTATAEQLLEAAMAVKLKEKK